MILKTSSILCFAVLCCVALSGIVGATQPTQSTNKLFMSPFYLASMSNNNNYNWSVEVRPPDGLTKVLSAIVTFDIYLNPSVNFTIQANGKPCSTYAFYVSTTYAGAGQARVSFDCSNVISKGGNYTITLRPSGANTGAVSGWLDLTYMNNPFGSMGIQGTEYLIGQNGTLFIKLLDSNELPINTGFCSIAMYYPNKTIKFMDNAPTTFLENGIYYKDFFVPDTEGLYIADAFCAYNDNVYRYNLPSEDCGYDGTVSGGTSPVPVIFRDIDCTVFHTLGGGTYQNWTFNYESLGLINLSQITQIDLNWVGQISAAGGSLSIYNFNTSSWNALGTTIASTGITLSCGNNVYITRSTTDNITSYVNNNTIKVRLYRAGTATMITDAMEVILHNNGSVVASLRGSSEVHVNNYFNQTSNLTVNLNQSQFTSILSAIASVNETLNMTVLDYLVSMNSSIGQAISQISAINDSVSQLGLNLTGYYSNITVLIDAHNVTLVQLIGALNDSQNGNYDSLYALVVAHNISMTDLMLSINQSSAAYANDIESQISNLQSYMQQHNQTIYDLLIQMNGSCYNNTDRILNYIDQHNMSISEILNSLNSTMYNSFSQIANALLNVSNNTINISLNIDDLYRRMRNILFIQTEPTRLESQQRIVTASFLPIASANAQSLYIMNSTCMGNDTLRQFYMEYVTLEDSGGSDFLNVTRYLDSRCSWGCDNSTAPPSCSGSPLSNSLAFFGFIGFMLLVVSVLYFKYYKKY